MVISRRQKPRFTLSLIALLITLQISACGSADSSSETAAIKGVDEPATIDTTIATNSVAVISGTDKGKVTEDVDSNNDGLLGASGKLNITDSDAGEAAFIATTVNSNYGSIKIDASGSWFYGATNSLSAIQNLNTNDTLTDRLTISSVDGTTHTVTITIKGVDEPATTGATTTNTSTTPTNTSTTPANTIKGVDEPATTSTTTTNTSTTPANTIKGVDEPATTSTTTTNTSTTPTNTSTTPANTIKGVDEPATTGATTTNTSTTPTNTSTTPANTTTTNTSTADTTTVTNSVAVISGTDKGYVTEDVDSNNDGLLGASGKLNITDSDAGEAAFIATTVNSNYGSIKIDASGSWFYGATNSLSAIQNLNTNDTLTDRLTISSVDGTTHTVTITIKGVDEPATTGATTTNTSTTPTNTSTTPANTTTTNTSTADTTTVTNSAAVISGTDKGKVTEDVDSNNDGLLGASGKLNITDSDAGEAAFIATTVNSNYGSIKIDASGSWFYGATNSLSAIQNLNTNDTLTDRLTISSVDGTTHTVTITIKGVDEPATTGATTTNTSTTPTNTSTTPANTTTTNTSTADTTTVTNSAAVISGTDKGKVTEDVDSNNDGLLGASGKLNITDSDAGEAAFIATTVNSNYGSIKIDASGNWFYGATNSLSAIQNLNTNDTLTDRLTISSVDGTTHTVTITIKGVDEPATTGATTTNTSTTPTNTSTTPANTTTTNTSTADTTTVTNSAAVISGTDKGKVTEDVDSNNDGLLGASGKLNITDSDAGEAAFIATTVNSNYGSIKIDASGNWFYGAINSLSAIQNLNTNDTLTDRLTISSVDGTTHTVTITIKGVDEPATAGATTTNTSTSVTSQTSATVADINLSWVAPAEREDNSAISLSEIAGYKIYYGNTPGDYRSSININDGSATSHTFRGFPAGTYYFVVTTHDTAGRESQFSVVVTITI